MKYTMIGHSLKKATEEMVIILFPSVKLTYEKIDKDPSFFANEYLVSRLNILERTITAEATLCMNGKKSYGYCVVSIDDIATGENQNKKTITELTEQCQKRHFSYAVREAIYMASEPFFKVKPEWGSLTGVRPSKTALNELNACGEDKEKAVQAVMKRYHVSKSRSDLAITCAIKGRQLVNGLGQKDAGIYISIPFCPTRCKYCSFVSHSISEAGYLVDEYIDTLEYEAQIMAKTLAQCGVTIRAVYIGGGTPTSLNAQQLEKVLKLIADNFDLKSSVEYTVEAGRPDTITEEKLIVMKKYGVTRISINPQSMNVEVLKAAARPHTPEDIINTFNLAKKIGFDNINMDIIAGLEKDNLISFKNTIDRLLELEPANITIHTLSYKKGADMKNSAMVFNNCEISKMLDYAYSRLHKFEYEPYYVYRQKYMAGAFENVGFSKYQYESLYNIAVMEETITTIGLGAGSSTKLVDCKTGQITREFNVKYPYEYVKHREKLQFNNNEIHKFYTEIR